MLNSVLPLESFIIIIIIIIIIITIIIIIIIIIIDIIMKIGRSSLLNVLAWL